MEQKDKKRSISIDVDDTSLDAAIEKANRLVALLREASAIFDSLAAGIKLKS